MIREATRPEHEATEAAIEERYFPGGAIDRDGYEDRLRAFLGFHRPLEERLAPAAEPHLATLSLESRARRLERDLEVLGHGPEELAAVPQVPCDRLPCPDAPGRLLGCPYVVEGGELGARVIWKMLHASLPEDALESDAFFGTDPERARGRWRRFGATFEHRVETGETLEDAVEAARSTFRALRGWMG